MVLMKVIDSFLHFFTPRYTNNHRATALSLSSFSVYIAFLLVFQVGLNLIVKVSPEVLGYATNISLSDLLSMTNEKRLENGVTTLQINDQLSEAAKRKAEDMFTNQYWAHNSPNGREPWGFITTSGYQYLYAGENLARDFAESKAVVEAWMNSSTHRENLVNPKYKEVGFAVVNGEYGGYETTLVVQMFGTKAGSPPSVAAPTIPKITEKTTTATPKSVEEIKQESLQVLPAIVANVPVRKADVFGVTKTVSIALAIMLILVLAVDAFLVYERKTVRISGHNLAHLMILFVLLVVLNLISRGAVI